MKVTPLEIRQQQFPLRFRGLDAAEVDKFLELVASDMEDLVRDNTRLREALAQKEQELQHMQQGEDEVKKALMAIQQIREDVIGRAEREAEQVLRESEQRAQQLRSEAEGRVSALQNDLEQLQRQKHTLVSLIRHILNEHIRLLETVAGDPDHSDVLSPPLLENSEPPG
jgi:cell division initiation protein